MRGNSVNRLEQVWPSTATPSGNTSDVSSWSDKAQTWEIKLERFIGNHPRAVLTAAAAAGLVLGWLVKRK